MVVKDGVEDRRNSSFVKRYNLPEEAKELTQAVNPETVGLALAWGLLDESAVASRLMPTTRMPEKYKDCDLLITNWTLAETRNFCKVLVDCILLVFLSKEFFYFDFPQRNGNAIRLNSFEICFHLHFTLLLFLWQFTAPEERKGCNVLVPEVNRTVHWALWRICVVHDL